MADFHDSYIENSLLVYRKNAIFIFKNEEEAISVREFFLNETTIGKHHSLDVKPDYSEDEFIKYRLVIQLNKSKTLYS